MGIQNILLAVVLSNRLKTVRVEKLRRGIKKSEVRDRVRDLTEQFRRAGVI